MGNLIDWNSIVTAAAPESPDFGDPRRGFEAARSGVIVTPLRQFELLRFHGNDAGTFLQGQLTCDVDLVAADQAQFGGYCTSKGRLLANFTLISTPLGYLMHAPADVTAFAADRLRKFILRSKVKIERENGVHVLGLAGPAAPNLLEREFGTVPQRRLGVGLNSRASVISLPGGIFLVLASSAEMPALWGALAQSAVPADTQCWSWVQIRAGLPWITQATQDQFLPQMIGLDAIGGVSFEKGCYTGQEIVARTQYLGEVKRRLRFGTIRGNGPVHAGDALVVGREHCGTVVNAAPVPGNGWALLAVVSEQAGGQAVQIASGESVTLSESATTLFPG